MAERDVQHAIRLALGRMTDVVLWRNSTGVARPNDRVVRYGLCVGSSDLIGILAPSGRFIALEVKMPVGRLTLEQRQFLELVRRRGGFACVVRSVDDAVAAMDRARAGASS
jgi:hypothetical protein